MLNTNVLCPISNDNVFVSSCVFVGCLVFGIMIMGVLFVEIFYGFQVMLQTESPDTVFTILKTRFQTGKKYTSTKLKSF